MAFSNRILLCIEERAWCCLTLELLGAYVVPLRWFLGTPLKTAYCIDNWLRGRLLPCVDRKQDFDGTHRRIIVFWLWCVFRWCATCRMPEFYLANLLSWALIRHKVFHAELLQR